MMKKALKELREGKALVTQYFLRISSVCCSLFSVCCF